MAPGIQVALAAAVGGRKNPLTRSDSADGLGLLSGGRCKRWFRSNGVSSPNDGVEDMSLTGVSAFLQLEDIKKDES